jgi:hypothetical protein
MPDCCEVALPVPLDRLFTYAVGEGQLRSAGRAWLCRSAMRS